MMLFWIGLMCGLWTGAPVGFLLAAILASGKNADRWEEENDNQHPL